MPRYISKFTWKSKTIWCLRYMHNQVKFEGKVKFESMWARDLWYGHRCGSNEVLNIMQELVFQNRRCLF